MSDLLHTLTCPIRSRWRRRRWHQPFWRQDKTARMLGVAAFGCHRCGRGAIEERDRRAADELRALLADPGDGHTHAHTGGDEGRGGA